MASYSYSYNSSSVTVTITGLTAGSSTYKVFIRLANDSSNVTVEQTTQTAGASRHTHTFGGLAPSTQYLLNVNVDGSWLGASTFTTSAVSPWSWSASTERQNFYNVLTGVLPANPEYLSHNVWNDLVDKVREIVVATKATYSGEWDNTYADYAATYCYSGDTLSAVKFNSLRQNVNLVCTKVSVSSLTNDGVGAVSAGQEILGSYITKVTSKINEIIENGW